jgi:hypothetical protein
VKIIKRNKNQVFIFEQNRQVSSITGHVDCEDTLDHLSCGTYINSNNSNNLLFLDKP